MNTGFPATFVRPSRRWTIVMTVLLLALPVLAQVSVLTHHNDNTRTGANLNETILTPSNVNVNQFGMLFKHVVDDQVYSQPLVATNVSMAGGTHNVVYITTVGNSVYAFDADDPKVTAPYWHVNFGPATANHFRCTDLNGNINIAGTPVIDENTNTLYVVSLNGSAQHLHALDIATGIERSGSPVTIAAPAFNAVQQNQRPALMLVNGVLYIGYSSHCDQGTYHGFLLAYNASTLQQVGIFNASPSGNGDSLWFSGAGPVADVNGNIYIITGNGSWDGVTNFSESFMKLSNSSLNMMDWFTPTNHATLDSGDLDLNSGGPMLLPGTSLVIGGGKGGVLYVVDTNHMGHLGDANAVQHFQASIAGGKGHIHSIAYWDSAVNGPMLYMWPQTDRFRVYKFNGSLFNTTPFMISPTANTGHPGGMLSISANGNTNGIVWAAIMTSGDAWHHSQPGILHALDANNINHELWNSLQNSARDNCNEYSKMTPPTIANGKVYLASFGTANTATGQLCVYGLLAPPSPDFSLGASPNSQTVVAGNSATYTATVTPSNGFSGGVTLSVGGLPAGATSNFSTNPVPGGSGSSTLGVSTSSTTPAGTYTLTITGTSGSLSHSTNVTLIVKQPLQPANCDRRRQHQLYGDGRRGEWVQRKRCPHRDRSAGGSHSQSYSYVGEWFRHFYTECFDNQLGFNRHLYPDHYGNQRQPLPHCERNARGQSCSQHMS